MSDISRSLFTGIPVEYVIPKATQVVIVSDFFAKDISGGAELTTEAIIKKCPQKPFRVHCPSVNKRLLDANKDKYWVFGNFATLSEAMLKYIPESGIRYSVIEYDFKFCAYRSINRHQQHTGQPCNCAKEVHGLDMQRFFGKAERIFWMSEGQKNRWLKYGPDLSAHPGHVVLSSVFDDDTLDLLRQIRETTASRVNDWGVLGGGSWIKGAEETQKWCKIKNKSFRAIPGLPYREFLKALNAQTGFIFRPLDSDTCPRVVIEAKLLGLDLILNDNVLHKNDPWFTGSVEDCEAYLRSRPSAFWDSLSLKSP